MKPRFLVVLLAPMLATCAGETIKKGMATFVGQPISAAIARLGFPTSEQTIAGAKVYTWQTSRLIEGTSVSCKIRAIVDAREIIATWDFEGSERGCGDYASALRQ